MVISHYLALAADEVFEGSIELDESYFCGRRKGRCGRSAAGKEVVFGVLKRNGRVCQILQDIGDFTLIYACSLHINQREPSRGSATNGEAGGS